LKHESKGLKAKTASLIIIMFIIVSAALIQMSQAQSVSASTNWNMNIKLQANGQPANNAQPVFAPFDLIQISTNITDVNVPKSNVLVSFDMKGPTTSSYPTEILRTAVTDTSGAANISFRIPLDTNERPIFGTWNIYANAQTKDGLIEQNMTFQVSWPIQVTEIDMSHSDNQNQTYFSPGDNASALLKMSSYKMETVNITLNIQDSLKKSINQTVLQNVVLNATDGNQVLYNFRIPNNTVLGLATLNSFITSESYQNTEIPAAENVTGYFLIIMNGSSGGEPTPTPTPSPVENAISLFSWLLVATGFFTFTALFMFLKRKSTPRMRNLPPTIPGPTVSAPPSFQTTAPQPIQQPTTNVSAPITSEKMIRAIVTTQAFEVPVSLAPVDIAAELKLEAGSNQENVPSIAANLQQISSAAKRIQTLQNALEMEKEQLASAVAGLNKTVEEQETAVKKYFDSIRQEIIKIEPLLTQQTKNQVPEENSNNKQVPQDKAQIKKDPNGEDPKPAPAKIHWII
jgi:hypothetical protein